ncbi:MAG TPA: hypothetical protein VLJ58_05840 [Ramlibacter sp.]|nr:hypothetical protein [Ramlibacter sp.]
MKPENTPFFRWVTLILLGLLALLTFTEKAWGQSPGAGAVFEGRPAMAGAQGGTGAMAGPPQGGLGVQGSEGQPGLRLPRPGTPVNPQALGPPREPGLPRAPAADETVRKNDPGIAKEQRSTTRKAKRAARRTLERARHGNAPIDSAL